MRVILDTHSQICCGPESKIFSGRARDDQNRLPIEKLSRKFDVPVAAIRQMLAASKSHAEFVDLFFKAYCRAGGKSFWAEKTPKNVLAIDYIFRHFPDARFIHVIRDGRAAICSLMTHPRHRVVDGKLIKTNIRNPIDQCVDLWVKCVGAGLAFRGDPRYVEVRYEELVLRPEKTLKHLFTFLGHEWEEELLSFHQVESSSRDVTRFPQNPEATRAIYTSAVARWRSEYSEAETAYIKKHAGALLRELGYDGDAW